MDLSTILFSFTGRLNRAPYWLAGIAMGVAVTLIVVGMAVVIGASGLGEGWWLAVPVILALSWISLALTTKRLHDRDKSAWWLLLFCLAPSTLQAVGSRVGSEGVILFLVSVGISIWGFVEMGCLRGTDGPNSYGPDPL
jgi:uncharacterized membrane protein YhaH (DUF805 family)